MTTSAKQSYTRVAIMMHWLVAILIFINFSVGLLMESFEGTPTRDSILFYHASVGSLIFFIVIYRLYWRVTHTPPALPPSISYGQAMIAHLMHGMLYVLMLVIPLTGFLHRAAGGHPVNFFGLGELPVFIGKNLPIRLFMGTAHTYLVWLLAFLVLGHIGAALKHHFIDRDNILTRMLR